MISKGFFNKVIITGAKLLHIEGILDADDDIATLGGEDRGILKPSGKISWRNFLLDFS